MSLSRWGRALASCPEHCTAARVSARRLRLTLVGALLCAASPFWQEALAHGLPMVVAPIKDDQPVVASQVEAAGAGVRVRFGRLRPEGLQHAVRTVLLDESYADAARRIAASFEAAGGAAAASRVLEGVL